MIHTCPVCNNVTCSTGSNVEFSRFAKFCTCGGIEGLKAQIERLQRRICVMRNAMQELAEPQSGDYATAHEIEQI